ncbi:peptide-methionine (R)-S-oxide reductase MsrB [Roseospira visakhapatnamensis]|uniref:peptide-methionine (R)-S-oxide reductase n=1 Tax=Roseospira visakhapatnamensis TaxID=390880 RepID=A0A7W6RBV9_9PROT|nr:peptide-methionine (R)-S-oxide reductase MsrB [Roseospira visakhapatnamensis]MBB4265124.1 peptide-methionine (R)-S-oxide reductase [Roseospira visakhapatnamensis]
MGGIFSRVLGAGGRDTAGEQTAFPVTRSEADWKATLSPEQFRVLRRHGTERPFSHPLNEEKRDGTFRCAGCGTPLFDAQTKYDSGSGWPSFFRPLDGAVGTATDHVLAMPRTEVHCAQCGGHLGHVFEDGPAPTGLRYCMNGAALDFEPDAGRR